ncbi:MAG TPA: hypothetical protein VHC19_25510 [Pirellulales bacterium]|jgi:hypothetical protein|nr:hypothetical protein [Pirellulales bacterium]
MEIHQVRQCVLDAITERGLGSATIAGETVLVREGFYVGRRFIFEELEAVWRLGADHVSLTTHAGETLAPIALQAPRSQRPAA